MVGLFKNAPLPGFGPEVKKRYMVGCDLAKTHDYTSISVIEMNYISGKIPEYNLVALDRIRGIDYPVIVKTLIKTVEVLSKTSNEVHLCIDASGLGSPVRDYLKQSGIFTSANKQIFPVVWTGGEAARYDTKSHNYNISKTLIISNFRNLMQHKRIHFAAGLTIMPQFLKEIESYEYQNSPSGKVRTNAKEGEHDDLVASVCIPLIIAEWRYVKSVGKIQAMPKGLA